MLGTADIQESELLKIGHSIYTNATTVSTGIRTLLREVLYGPVRLPPPRMSPKPCSRCPRARPGTHPVCTATFFHYFRFITAPGSLFFPFCFPFFFLSLSYDIRQEGRVRGEGVKGRKACPHLPVFIPQLFLPIFIAIFSQ